MNSRDFCYWLQGYFEIDRHSGMGGLEGRQIEVIRKHLDMVFVHEIDPQINSEHDDMGASLDAIHDGKAANIDWNVPDTGPYFKPWPKRPGARC